MDSNQIVLARRDNPAETVVIDEMEYSILTDNQDFISLFRPGRSTYKPGVGSEYEPARIFFCQILETSPEYYQLKFLLEAPIRRR